MLTAKTRSPPSSCRGGGPQHQRPHGPGCGRVPLVGWSGQDLELVHRRGALTVCGAQTVGAGVAAADDDDALARRGDRRDGDVALLHLVRDRQVLHRLVDAGELTPRYRQVTPLRGAAGQHDCVELGSQFRGAHVDADVDVHPELGAFGLHLRHAPVDEALLHLELGDPVAKQSTDPVGTLEHHHGVAGPRELLGGSEPGGSRTDDRDLLAGLHRRDDRLDRTVGERPLDDLVLDLLDRHRRLVDAQHA